MAGDVLDERVAAFHMQKVAVRADVHPFMIKAVSDALLKNDDLVAPTAMFLLIYVKKQSNCVKTKD